MWMIQVDCAQGAAGVERALLGIRQDVVLVDMFFNCGTGKWQQRNSKQNLNKIVLITE
jgi:hypothetical protein